MCSTKIKTHTFAFCACHIKRRRLDLTTVSSAATMLVILTLTTGWQTCARTLGCTDCTCATPPTHAQRIYNKFK